LKNNRAIGYNRVIFANLYGGMVATGVADRARDKIKHLVYLDAVAPESGKSASDFFFGRPSESERPFADPGFHSQC
jgi:pimeloyl-ACP methyl ester carboxylesterase